jgi:hypothetical protein
MLHCHANVALIAKVPAERQWLLPWRIGEAIVFGRGLTCGGGHVFGYAV